MLKKKMENGHPVNGQLPAKKNNCKKKRMVNGVHPNGVHQKSLPAKD
jgi:hypothetical protein